MQNWKVIKFNKTQKKSPFKFHNSCKLILKKKLSKRVAFNESDKSLPFYDKVNVSQFNSAL